MADSFDKLPLAIAPRELDNPKYPGKYMPVVFQGKPTQMSVAAVKERMQAGERIQIATWDEVGEARSKEKYGGVGGGALAVAGGVANGALLNLGVPLTHAALSVMDPELGKSFQNELSDIQKQHGGKFLIGELGGALTPLPGHIVKGVVRAGRGIAEAFGGAKAAEAMAAAAEAKGALAAAGEAAPETRTLARGGAEARGALPAGRAGPPLLPPGETPPGFALPEGGPTPLGPPGATARAALEMGAAERELAPAAEARALAAGEGGAARMLPAAEEVSPKAAQVANEIIEEAPLAEEAKKAARAPTLKEIARSKFPGKAIPALTEAEELGLASEREIFPSGVGEEAGGPLARVRQATARAAAEEAVVPPSPGEIFAPGMRRGAAAAEAAATGAPTTLKEAGRAAFPGKRIGALTEAQEAALAGQGEAFPSGVGEAPGGPLGRIRGEPALSAVRRASQEIPEAFPGARGAAEAGEAAAGGLPKTEADVDEFVRRLAQREEQLGAGKAATGESEVDQVVREAAEKEARMGAGPGGWGTVGGRTAAAEGTALAPGAELAGGAEAAAAEAGAPEAVGAPGEAGLVPRGGGGAALEGFEQLPPEQAAKFAGRIREIKSQSLATVGERTLMAQQKAEMEVAKAHADGVREIAKGMGTVPSALDPEFLVRAFIEGSGSRLSYNTVNDKANTIPGIVGDGVMAAVAAAGMHAGLAKMLSKYGSRAGAAIAAEEKAFQEAMNSTDPAEKVSYLTKQLQNAAARKVGLDKARFLESMSKYMPETDDFAGGFEYVAQTLLRDLPRAHGKTSLAGFKSYEELYGAINKSWKAANEPIDKMLQQLDNIATGGPMHAPGFEATKIGEVYNALKALEQKAMATRTLDAGGPATAKAVREATVEFLRMQGALNDEFMSRMGVSIDALNNPQHFSIKELENFLNKGWHAENVSYAGLKNTALEMRKLSYRGELDPVLRGSKETFAQVRGVLEDTLETDMNRVLGDQKYKYAKRQWQAWNYINEAMEEKIFQEQAAKMGGANVVSILARMGVTGYTAMFHPVTAAAMGAGFIAPKLASLNSVQNAWMHVLQKISGGIHIDNKRLAMAAAMEKNLDEFMKVDLSKVPAGKTKVVPADSMYEALIASRALAENPRQAMEAMQRVAQSAGAVSPELATESLGRMQKAIAALGAALPRAMKSDQWGHPNADARIDPFELKRWQNVFMGIVDPASVFDDMKMGDVSPDKAAIQNELYPEMTQRLTQSVSGKMKVPKIPAGAGMMKVPKLHYEKASVMKSLMGPHASIGMDTEHFRSAQDSYKQMEPQGQGGGPPGGGGAGGAMAPPSRMAAYQAPFGVATGMATGTQITTRRA